MKETIRLLFYILVVALLITACKKESNPVQSKDQDPAGVSMQMKTGFPILDNVRIIEGRMYFENIEEFRGVIQTLFLNQHELDGFESQFKGFTSSRMAFEAVTEEVLESTNGDIEPFRDFAILLDKSGEQAFERVIDPEILAMLFNQEGIIQIGNYIIKETYDYFYKVDIESYQNNKSFNPRTPGIEIYPIQRKAVVQGLGDNTVGYCEKKYSNNKKRMNGELNQFTSWFYSNITVETKHRKKGFLGWWYADKVQQLHLDGSGTYDWSPMPMLTDFSVNETKSWKSDIQEMVDFSINCSCYPFFETDNSTHSMLGPSYSCNISF